MQSTTNYAQSSKPSTMTGSYGHGSHYSQNLYQPNTQLYTQTPPPSTDNLDYSQAAMHNLAQAFGATNLASGVSVPVGKQNNGSYGANATNGSIMSMQSPSQIYYHQLPDGTVVMSGMSGVPGSYYPYAGAYNMGISNVMQYPQHAYNGYAASTVNATNNSWAPSQNAPMELPDLAAPRRNSQSSNEGSPGPHTPFNYGMFPSSAYAYQTFSNGLSPWEKPTPIQLARNFPFEQLWRTRENIYELVDYFSITQANPAIPVAVPAKLTKDSGRGTFDKILDNEHGTTNVYIRGLHPNTTDGMLEAYGHRFGDIKRCKAIIDMSTGGCKGYVNHLNHLPLAMVLIAFRFGFVEYHNYVDAENCIRCFYYLGYEAKFAKVCWIHSSLRVNILRHGQLSHNERLKNCADPENNNLYVSNLPKAMTESVRTGSASYALVKIVLTSQKELRALFTKVFPLYNVTSTKVLKDEQGISRGVGFVR